LAQLCPGISNAEQFILAAVLNDLTRSVVLQLGYLIHISTNQFQNQFHGSGNRLLEESGFKGLNQKQQYQ